MPEPEISLTLPASAVDDMLGLARDWLDDTKAVLAGKLDHRRTGRVNLAEPKREFERAFDLVVRLERAKLEAVKP